MRALPYARWRGPGSQALHDNAPDRALARLRIARGLGIVLYCAVGLALWSVPFLGLWQLFR